MADYSGAYERFDPMPSPAIRNSAPEEASILNVKTTKTVTIDFGRGPYTVEHFRELVRQMEDMPSGKKVSITYYDSQRDGETFKVTIS